MPYKKHGKGNRKCAEVAPMSEPKSVNVRTAKNGFVVNSYYDGKDQTYIAKTQKEAQKHVAKLLRNKK